MPKAKPLDLSEVDPSVWRVLVSDEVYGPYTLGQVRQFIKEGRISARSKISEGNNARFIAAGTCPTLSPVFEQHIAETSKTTPANLVIIAQLLGDDRALIDALNQLGSFGEAMPGVFLLRSSARLPDIHTRLTTVAREGEKIMIVDASNNRLAWLGLGEDTDEHIRAVWRKAA